MKAFSNEEILHTITQIADDGINHFESKYKDLSDSSKFELYMFNILLAWNYFLERDQIDTTSHIGNQKITRLIMFARVMNLNLEVKQIVEIYKERYKNFKADIRGLQNSRYLETKQYLPAYSFSAIIHEQLSLNPSTKWFDFDDLDNFDPEKSMELTEFTGALIDQINWILRRLEIRYTVL